MGAHIRSERLLFARSDGQLARVFFVGKELDALVFQNRRLRRERSRFFILLRKFARLDLAGFDIGLVEAVDSDYRSGNRGGNLPAEELLADVVLVEHLDAHDGESSLLERVDLGVLGCIRSTFEA